MTDIITSADGIPTIAISDLRRKFGEIEALLPHIDKINLTKNGKVIASIVPDWRIKRKVLLKFAGSWKGTKLDNDNVWKDVLTRKSRKDPIII